MSSEKYSTNGSEFCNVNGNGKDSVYGNANVSRKVGTKGIAISNAIGIANDSTKGTINGYAKGIGYANGKDSSYDNANDNENGSTKESQLATQNVTI